MSASSYRNLIAIKMTYLRFTAGPRTDEIVEIGKPKVSFGRRRSSDCVLDHKTVSRDHFYIELVGNKYLLVDNDSGNGTVVNGQRVTWVELKNGDVIHAGPFELQAAITNGEGNGDQSVTARGDTAAAFSKEHELAYPSQYLSGITCFNQRNYYDAHEVWEEIWLHAAGEEKLFYQMLIQSAVGLHHYERGNARGARGMYNAAMEKLKRLPSEFMSIDLARFAVDLSKALGDSVATDLDSIIPSAEPRPRIELQPIAVRSSGGSR